MLRVLSLAIAVLALLLAGCLSVAPSSESDNVTLQCYATCGSIISQEKANAQSRAYEQGYKDCYQLMISSYDLLLKRPTSDEVKSFLDSDDTSKLRSIDCLIYSTTFRDHAIKEGFWCYIVIFNWSSGSGLSGWHALNGFDTKDKGLIYIEPMSGKIVDLELGRDYSPNLCIEGNFCPLCPMFVREIGIAR